MGGGREVLEGGDIYIHTHTAMTDTRCIAETSTMQSNYPIKKKKIIKYIQKDYLYKQ